MISAFKSVIKQVIRSFASLREFLKGALPYRVQLFMFSRVYEPEILILKKLLESNTGSAVDVGANHGIYTYYLARVCKFERVLAFEPNPIPFRILEKKTKSYKNVEILNIGVSDIQDSILSLNIPVDSKGRQITTRSSFDSVHDRHISIDVPVTTLDSFELRNVAFIKVDVEGFEESVFRGAMATIKESKPVLLVETDLRDAGDSIREIISLGYSCYRYIDGKLSLIDDGESDDTKKGANVFLIPDGYNGVLRFT